MTRKSMFDGSFYPPNKAKIIEFIRRAIQTTKADDSIENAFGYVAPHAGYIYSGKTAAYTYKALANNKNLESIDSIVVVGPNHTGMGKPISVSLEDWETPVGVSLNDKELSKSIAANSEYIDINEDAHRNEHSIEVQLPFLQHVAPGKKVSFICMGDQSERASAILADSIIKSSGKLGRKILVLASSDFNHYESAAIAKQKDSKLLDAIKELDHKRFNRLVHELNDTACGFGPITVAMLFARHKGAKKGSVLTYTNSGDQTGDYSSVVAYSSIVFI
jgi:MEMO1 family protein